ncbi:hypothetical protein DYB25_005522 [Aphanomyces astaci]|uniref:Uncharacterized protein n=1 Tax=Aphanomyces astaci TaxID=112090 RepID=A0A397AW63_APHAT|nr:hypothetical protein DYB25_005522 [Aphanomyces astaci]
MCTRARVWGGEMSPSLAAHLLLISQVNAHAFRAADPDIGDTVMSALHPNQSDDLPPSAVFRVASKAQHSCSPNTCKKTIAAEDLKAAMALETALERNLDNAKEQMLVAGKSPSTIRAMGMARDAIAEFLSPLHYLQFESLKLVATTAAFLAREMDAKSIFTTEVNPKVAYKRAAEAWRDLVRRREHASAVIEGRLTFDDACRRLHELNPPWDVAVPSLQCSSNEAFYAGVDFLKAGCPREAADIYRRHLDGILFSLSPIDPDADFVRDVVSKHSS